MYCGKPYPQRCLTSTVRWYHGFDRFSGTDRSPDPFLMVFAIFSLKSSPNMMVTPSQQRPTTHDSAVLPIRSIFRVRSPDPFLTIFATFSLKSSPNILSGQGIHLMRVQRTFITCSFSSFMFSSASTTPAPPLVDLSDPTPTTPTTPAGNILEV